MRPVGGSRGEGVPDRGRVLLHVCCGPCAIHPHRSLLAEGYRPEGLFYNPNIQPSREYRRRQETAQEYAASAGLPLAVAPGYRPEVHLRATLDAQADRMARCRACYTLRLDETAREAVRRGVPAFTSTLLVSPYQLHDEVRRAGEAAAAGAGVEFVYRDFRSGWPDGVKASRELGLYRQPYCGCLWSEVERYERAGN